MDGGMIIDKPAGMTSHDVVSSIRRLAGIRRIGHAGTLDPFATGVLVVCVGRSTRLVQFLAGLDKEYQATIRLGFATDTQDLTGKQIGPPTSSNKLSEDEIDKVLSESTGPQMQVPPMYSAKKVGGQRLYRTARAGGEVDRKPCAIEIKSISRYKDDALRAENADGTVDFDVTVRCSSGTYIRTLAHDIGARLGVGAHLAALRRTAVGQFGLKMATTLDDLQRQAAGTQGGLGNARGNGSKEQDGCVGLILSPATLVSHLPSVRIELPDVVAVKNGREISGYAPDGDRTAIALLSPEGGLVAVGRYVAGRESIQPFVVLDVDDDG